MVRVSRPGLLPALTFSDLMTAHLAGQPPEKSFQRQTAVQRHVECGAQLPHFVQQPEELAYIQDLAARWQVGASPHFRDRGRTRCTAANLICEPILKAPEAQRQRLAPRPALGLRDRVRGPLGQRVERAARVEARLSNLARLRSCEQ